MLVSALALSAGCSVGTPVPAASPSGMVPYTAPPAAVPVVEVDGAPLRPAQYAWRIAGTYRTHAPASDRDVATNSREQSDGDLAFALLTTVRPLQARVLLYNDLDANEVPAEGSGSVLDCIAQVGCRIVEGTPDILIVEVTDRPVAPAMVVLDVQYGTLEPADTAAGIASYGASWVIRLRAKP